MVHVAGGEGGSIRHDDDGRPALQVRVSPTCRSTDSGRGRRRAGLSHILGRQSFECVRVIRHSPFDLGFTPPVSGPAVP